MSILDKFRELSKEELRKMGVKPEEMEIEKKKELQKKVDLERVFEIERSPEEIEGIKHWKEVLEKGDAEARRKTDMMLEQSMVDISTLIKTAAKKNAEIEKPLIEESACIVRAPEGRVFRIDLLDSYASFNEKEDKWPEVAVVEYDPNKAKESFEDVSKYWYEDKNIAKTVLKLKISGRPGDGSYLESNGECFMETTTEQNGEVGTTGSTLETHKTGEIVKKAGVRETEGLEIEEMRDTDLAVGLEMCDYFAKKREKVREFEVLDFKRL